MKKQLRLLLLLVVCTAMATSCKEKKVIVMASGKLKVEGHSISLEPDFTHTEKELLVDDGKITIKQGTTVMDIPVADAGLYILNMKPDTLVGSYQHLGTDNSPKRLTQEDLQKSIDSLQLLITGANVSPEKRNYFITPGKLVKVTENTKAQIIGPYLKMPGSFEAGREYEIYKFYTNKEIRETIDKLKKLQ